MQVTTLEDLRRVKSTEVVPLSNFPDGTPLKVEMGRPNLLELIMGNKIPNTLLDTAMKMQVGKNQEVISKAQNDVESLRELVNIMEVMARECMVSPSYQDILDCGLKLTEDQLMDILLYSQRGIKGLENFRIQSIHPEGDKPVIEIPEASIGDN